MDVAVNGKHVATMGMPGEGGFSANVSCWSRAASPYRRRPRGPDVLELYLGGTDRNNPTWDRFYEWPAPKQLRTGDEIVLRIIEGTTPDRPKFRMKTHRIDEDQFPSPENPTFVVVRNVSVWADKHNVLLRAYDKGNVPRLTAHAARKVARALVRAAKQLEHRRRRRRS
jgi:hypothetical protein